MKGSMTAKPAKNYSANGRHGHAPAARARRGTECRPAKSATEFLGVVKATERDSQNFDPHDLSGTWRGEAARPGAISLAGQHHSQLRQL